MNAIIRLNLALLVCVAIWLAWRLAPPFNEAIYIGHRWQWIIWFEEGYIGPVSHPLHAGRWVSVFFYLATYALPVWVADRFVKSRLPARADSDDTRCPNCGYDIRANLEQCSECGEPIKRKPEV